MADKYKADNADLDRAIVAVAEKLDDLNPECIKDSLCGDRVDLHVSADDRLTVSINLAPDVGIEETPLDTRPDETTYVISRSFWRPLPDGSDEEVCAVVAGPDAAAGAARGLLARLEADAEEALAREADLFRHLDQETAALQDNER